MALQKLKSLSSGYGDDRYAPIVNAFESIGQGLSRYQENQNESLKQLAQEKANEESLQIERELGKRHNVPEFVFEIKDPKQRQFWLKHYLKPKSLGEHVSNIADRLFGSGQNQNQQNQIPTIIRGNNDRPVGVQIGSQLISADEISPETLQNIEMLEQQQALANQQPSTFGTKLGNALTGLGTRAVSLGSGGDIAGLLGSAVSGLSNLVQTPEIRETEKAKWAERLKGLSPQQISSLAQEGAFNQLANPEEVNEAAMNFVPTAQTLRKGIEKATEGTKVEKYVASKNSTDEIWKELGDIAGILSNPLSGAAKGLASGSQGINKAKDIAPFVKKIVGNIAEVAPKKLPQIAGNILKASGVALTGKGAGWLTEAYTGSEKLGKGVQNGIYLAYSLFPGFAGKLGQKSYDDYQNNVINKAVSEGKKVDLNPIRDQLNRKGSIGKKIDRLSSHSEAGSFIRNEQAMLQANLQEVDGHMSPDTLWSNIKEMNKRLASSKTPDQAKGVFKDMIKVQEDALKKFSDTIAPEGGKLLEMSNDFWKTKHAIEDAQQVTRDVLNPRSFNAGAAFWLGGGYKALMKLSIAESARQFATKMLQSPAVRDSMSKLFHASTTQNAVLTKKYLDELEKSSNKILNSLPAKDREEITKVLKKVQADQIS